MSSALPSDPPPTNTGTRDGTGAGDHDQPYYFGRRPRTTATFPFSEREYARLLVLRSRHQDRLFDADAQ